MTNYDGKGSNYVAGKLPVNREPGVSKYLVEKLYRIHREKLDRVSTVTDSHLIVPDFLVNQSWKKFEASKKKKDLLHHNQTIFNRITKAENADSIVNKDVKIHERQVNDIKTIMGTVKETGRLKKLLKIQKDNEFVLQRIENAKPIYTLRSMKEWYKPHIMYKVHRRTDPTGGHIMRSVENLMPGPLPPIDPDGLGSTFPLVAAESRQRNQARSVYDANGTTQRRTKSLISTSSSVSFGSSSFASGSLSRQASANMQITGGLRDDSMADMPDSVKGSFKGTRTGSSNLSVSAGSTPAVGSAVKGSRSQVSSQKRRGAGGRTASKKKRDGDKSKVGVQSRGVSQQGSRGLSTRGTESLQLERDGFSPDEFGDDTSRGMSRSGRRSRAESDSASPIEITPMNDTKSDFEHVQMAAKKYATLKQAHVDPAYTALTSRPFQLPHETRNCIVQISVKTEGKEDDNFYLKAVLGSGLTGASKVICERTVTRDQATQIVNSTSNLAQQAAMNDDLEGLRSVLIDMFNEADDDNNGYLTFDEFQQLLERVDLGISPQEMRFVISEADENDNGVVDFHEFLPLAIDMIQSFQARNRAKNTTSKEDMEIEEIITASISIDEIDIIYTNCMKKIREFDGKGFGCLRPPEIRKCFTQLSHYFANEKEIHMIIQLLKRDPFGRCSYTDLKEVIGKVRFTTLKNAYIEDKASDLHKHLLEVCREEEKKSNAQRDKGQEIETGRLPVRAMTQILMSSKRIQLSRLQVLVIMSEASVLEGMIDYNSFIPMMAKTIELLLEPKTLRRRAELIEKTDLSAEALVQGMASEDFNNKMSALFNSYDVDRSGLLDTEEFFLCIKSLDFKLTDGEIAALKMAADNSGTGVVSFDDFKSFFTGNLLSLEKEKHVQNLRETLHDKSLVTDAKKETEYYSRHLQAIFKLSDPSAKGFLSPAELETLIKQLDMNMSEFQTECLLCELQTNEDGLINYREFIPLCADVLTTFKAREKSMAEHHLNKKWAQQKARKVIKAASADIQRCVRYIKERIRLIEDTVDDAMGRMSTIQEVVRGAHSGLNRQEANHVVQKLFTLDAINSRARHSFRPSTNSMSVSPVPRASVSPSGVAAELSVGSLCSDIDTAFGRVLSVKELKDAIVEAKEATIMRSLLEEIDPDSLHGLILNELEKELLRLICEGYSMPNTDFLPVTSCYRVLEGMTTLQLSKAQVMAIISWVEEDFYDKSGTAMNFRKFARFAAGVITKMRNPEAVDDRAAALESADIDDDVVMKGVTPQVMEEWLFAKFSEVSNINGEITADQFCTALESLPHLGLTGKDATKVLGHFPRTDSGALFWKEFLPWSHNTILTLLREKVIADHIRQRAESNKLIKDREFKFHDLRVVSDKLIEYVKLRQTGTHMYLMFPGDKIARKPGGNGEEEYLVTMSQTPSRMDSRNFNFAGEDDDAGGERIDSYYRDTEEVTGLSRASLLLPMKYSAPMQILSPQPSRKNLHSSTQNLKSLTSMQSMSAMSSNLPMDSPMLGDMGGGGRSTPGSANSSRRNSKIMSSSSIGGAGGGLGKLKNVAMSTMIATGHSARGGNNVPLPPLPKYAALVRIVAVSKKAQIDKELYAHIVGINDGYAEKAFLPIKLPTIGIVDKESAQLYAKNLMDKLYIEVPHPTFAGKDVAPKKLKISS